jgi:hypothetical protein
MATKVEKDILEMNFGREEGVAAAIKMENISRQYLKPILIIAQRNSSLDVLVEKCIDEFGLVPIDLERFGEQSNSAIVEPFKFSNQLKLTLRNSSFAREKSKFTKELDELNKVGNLDDTIKFLDNHFEDFRRKQFEFSRNNLKGAKILAMTT